MPLNAKSGQFVVQQECTELRVKLTDSIDRELARRSHASGLLHMVVFSAIAASTSIPTLYAAPFYWVTALGCVFAVIRFLLGRSYASIDISRRGQWRFWYYTLVLLMAA